MIIRSLCAGIMRGILNFFLILKRGTNCYRDAGEHFDGKKKRTSVCNHTKVLSMQFDVHLLITLQLAMNCSSYYL